MDGPIEVGSGFGGQDGFGKFGALHTGRLERRFPQMGLGEVGTAKIDLI
jgi:hypothetical protein